MPVLDRTTEHSIELPIDENHNLCIEQVEFEIGTEMSKVFNELKRIRIQPELGIDIAEVLAKALSNDERKVDQNSELIQHIVRLVDLFFDTLSKTVY